MYWDIDKFWNSNRIGLVSFTVKIYWEDTVNLLEHGIANKIFVEVCIEILISFGILIEFGLVSNVFEIVFKWARSSFKSVGNSFKLGGYLAIGTKFRLD